MKEVNKFQRFLPAYLEPITVATTRGHCFSRSMQGHRRRVLAVGVTLVLIRNEMRRWKNDLRGFEVTSHPVRFSTTVRAPVEQGRSPNANGERAEAMWFLITTLNLNYNTEIARVSENFRVAQRLLLITLTAT